MPLLQRGGAAPHQTHSYQTFGQLARVLLNNSVSPRFRAVLTPPPPRTWISLRETMKLYKRKY